MNRWIAAGLFALASCAQPAAPPESAAPLRAGEPAVVVTAEENVTPTGGDGGPRLSLALRMGDGSLRPIAEKALAFAPFRDGVALVAVDQQLALVAADGSRTVLARKSGAPPRRGPNGELWYVARYDQGSEVHVLEVQGRDRIIASGLASAGLLAPQADGRLFMVAADARGVAGLWHADAGGARCLTNCDLVAGQPWGDRFVPLPASADAIEVEGDRVTWDAADGTRRSVVIGADPDPDPGKGKGTGKGTEKESPLGEAR